MVKKHNCIVCGKIITKSIEPIGPVCAKKMSYSVPKKKNKINAKHYCEMLSKHDIFSKG